MIDEGKQLHIKVAKDLYTKLKVRCAYEGISIQDHLIRLIRESMGQHRAHGGSLLIVEDEAILRESLKDSLKDAHAVVTAGAADEALDLIRKQDFDIVITDVRLPGKNGLELIKEVKEMKPYIKSIVITAYPSVELAVETMKQGAVDYLTKPVRAEDLERLIWQVLRKQNNGEEAGD